MTIKWNKDHLKKGQLRAIIAKLWKNVFHEKFAVGESLLTLVAEHGSKNLELRCTINDTKGLPDNQNKWPWTSLSQLTNLINCKCLENQTKAISSPLNAH